MSNKKRGVFDTGAVYKNATEEEIVMRWGNCLKAELEKLGHFVVRTRIDKDDPAPVSRRDDVAASFRCDRMISLHTNSGTGRSNGTETFYRGADDKAMAVRLTDAVCKVLGTRNRGAKTEQESQHSSLAVMEFDKCWLVELAFGDNAEDLAKLLNPKLMQATCAELARVITA